MNQSVGQLQERQDVLSKQRIVLKNYLLSKASSEDWHAVADAAMDLRELEAEAKVIQAVTGYRGL